MNKLKKSMRSALAVAVAMAAFMAMAGEKVELLDAHQEDPNKSTLAYTYRTTGLDSTWKYNLRLEIRAKAGEPSKRMEMTKVFTNAISSVNGTATEKLDLATVFGPDVYPECEVFLSLLGVVEKIPVGTIFDFMGSTPPPGYLLCDGAEVSRSQYARLYSVLGDNCGPCDDKTKFRLPNFSGRVTQGRDDKEIAGSSVDAGVPNITGRTSLEVYAAKNRPRVHTEESGTSGAFSAGDGVSEKWYIAYASFGDDHVTFSTLYKQRFLTLDASRGERYLDGREKSEEDRVYGKSDTVQPAAVLVTKIIKY